MYNLILFASIFRLTAVAIILIQCGYILTDSAQVIASIDVLLLSSGLIILGNFCTYLINYTYGKNS